MAWIAGDVSGSQTLQAEDHLYETHINELRQVSDANTAVTSIVSNYIKTMLASADAQEARNILLSQAMTAVVIGPSGSGADYECDGVADQVQINQAFAYVNNAGGGAVHFLVNEYLCNSYITILSDLQITGAGDASAIKMINGVNIDEFIRATAIDNTSIRYIKVDYNHQNNTSCGRAMRLVAPCTYLTIEHCTFINAKGFAIGYWGHGTGDVTIRSSHCKALYNTIDVTNISSQNDILLMMSNYGLCHGNRIIGHNTNGGIVIYESDYLICTNNHVSSTTGNLAAIGVWSLRWGLVSGNNVEGSGDGVGIQIYTELDNPVPTTSSYNHIYGNTVTSFAAGISLVMTEWDVVEHNNIDGCYKAINFGAGAGRTAAIRPTIKFNTYTNCTVETSIDITPVAPYFLGNNMGINGKFGVNLFNISTGQLEAPTAQLDVVGSSASASGFRIRSGTAPTSPNSGDIWFDGTDLKIRVGATTKTFTLV